MRLKCESLQIFRCVIYNLFMSTCITVLEKIPSTGPKVLLLQILLIIKKIHNNEKNRCYYAVNWLTQTG